MSTGYISKALYKYRLNLFFKKEIKMKSIVAIIAALSIGTAVAAEPAKAPTGSQNRVEAPAPAASAPAKAEEKKPEMKLAKKKEDKPADATKSQAPAQKEPAKAAEPAKK